MFWHSQLFHARPENHSDPPQIRQAVIWDCAKRSIDDPHRPRELLQDPWHEWAACVRCAGAAAASATSYTALQYADDTAPEYCQFFPVLSNFLLRTHNFQSEEYPIG